MVFKQALVLLLAAVVIGLAVNTVSPNRIDFIGRYRDLSSDIGSIVPPDAQEGDPPFVDINLAQFEFASATALFVDAREPDEFECGTIPGSINIPFEHLPDDLEAYLDSALQDVPRDYTLIIFCGGEECDLSLHLARNLQGMGYTKAAVFFGGAREWEKFGLEVERRGPCGQ